MRFSRQEYWNRLPFLSPRHLPDLLAYKLAKCFSSNALDLSTLFCGTQARFQIFWEEVSSHCYQASSPYSCSPWSYSSQWIWPRIPLFSPEHPIKRTFQWLLHLHHFSLCILSFWLAPFPTWQTPHLLCFPFLIQTIQFQVPHLSGLILDSGILEFSFKPHAFFILLLPFLSLLVCQLTPSLFGPQKTCAQEVDPFGVKEVQLESEELVFCFLLESESKLHS